MLPELSALDVLSDKMKLVPFFPRNTPTYAKPTADKTAGRRNTQKMRMGAVVAFDRLIRLREYGFRLRDAYGGLDGGQAG